uniref:Uncharacterized protein n=1 Tax=Siphoviridae sp. ct2vX3 TaxID=2825318 RepID=A0A8S5PYK7_9CAUD|nr:MAG TPA: hypothetical protein [Siphoviridae sp. ct2vX3]
MPSETPSAVAPLKVSTILDLTLAKAERIPVSVLLDIFSLEKTFLTPSKVANKPPSAFLPTFKVPIINPKVVKKSKKVPEPSKSVILFNKSKTLVKASTKLFIMELFANPITKLFHALRNLFNLASIDSNVLSNCS